MSEEQAPEIQINVKGPSELKLQISITTDKTVLELKQAIAAKSDVEAERQRLIYSGRVLKDDDLLSVYKIQSNHTIHMVKGVSRSTGGAPSSSGAPAAPQQPPPMQTGQNVHDPLTQLNGHMGFGAMAGLNPFGEMGLNQNDPNMMQSMMNSPQFMQQMSAMMSNPAIIDQVIAMNPQLAAMGPQVRAAFQDEGFRQMISNPEYMQQMMRMASMFRDSGAGGGLGGGGGFGSPFGAPPPAFPAPGNPNPAGNSTPSTGTPTTASPGTTSPPPANPFNMFGGLGAAGAGMGAGAGTGMGTGSPAPGAGANPFGFNPALMQQMLGGMGGGMGGFGATSPPPPADARPPEERFQVQLQQLQDMGFTNAAQNVRALLATGGNVQGAIDYIFSGGGI
jgi:ubiquilin